MRFVLFLVAGILGTMTASSQGTYVPLGEQDNHLIDRYRIIYNKILPHLHANFKPYNRKMVAAFADSLANANINRNSVFRHNLRQLRIRNSEWSTDTFRSRRKLFNIFYTDPSHLYSVKTEDFLLKVNPIFEYRIGFEKDAERHYFKNTRGLELRASISDKLSLYTYLTENQTRPYGYVQSRINQREAVPGEGFFKDFKQNGVDYFTARGYIAFNVLEHIDIQFGHGKHFIGNGHRSLMLSDYGNNMLFLKLNTRIRNLRYTNLFTQMTQQYDRGPDRLLDKKYGAFHHLNLAVTDWLDVGLFEGVIFARDNGYELQYLNPIIFYRSVEQELGSPDNAMVGLDFEVRTLNHLSLYGQLVFDEFNFSHIRARDGWWGNKFGIQAGLQYVDIFGLSNLDGRFEFNMVRPYMYTHTDAESNYTHYNQPLAHPLGANFREFIGELRYQPIEKFRFKAKLIRASYGADSSGKNWGSDIFMPNQDQSGGLNVEKRLGNEMLQGVRQDVTLAELLITYEFWYNIKFDLNVVLRQMNSEVDSRDRTTVFGGVGLRWNIPHKSYDF